ncbi:MAG TPA: lysophospholipase [Vulgatibacter sp.]|nr:lysophospholipase [Vulgatibacter sp.]
MEPVPRQEVEARGKGGVPLFCRRIGAEGAAGQVLFVHGYGEHAGRYLELFDALAKSGSLCVHAIDLRGHGRSGGRPGHVERFDDYLDDVDVAAGGIPSDRPLFVVGHSMGALVLARWLEAGRGTAAGAVFASPYLELTRPPPPLKVAIGRAIGVFVPWIPLPSGLRIEDLTRDPDWREATRRDPLYRTIATPGWFDESNAARKLALAEAGRITPPSLVLVPEEDAIASPAAARVFFDALGAADKRLVTFPGAGHELFHELPETRRAAIAEVERFVAERLSPAGIAGTM